MKRTLSLVLALVMVLGSFTTVFAAPAAVEVDAAEFLEAVGVLQGNDDGDLMLEKNLERRDAVILLSRLLGVEDEAAEFLATEESPSWEDARTDVYYIPFFAWAEENGYFEGDDEGNFNPRNPITAQEYALVLLRAMGYEADGHDAWKAALETAGKLGLLADVEVEDKDEVVRGQMAVMTLNALKAEGGKLAEELGIQLPKPATIEVENVYADNLKQIFVEFNNEVDEDSAVKLDNYTFDEKLEKAEVLEDGKTVVLTLVEDAAVELESQKEYKLTVNNVLLANSDVKLAKTEVKFVAVDVTLPAIKEVVGLGTKALQVIFTEPVTRSSASRMTAYRIDDKVISGSIKYEYPNSVIISTNMTVGDHELSVKDVEDFAKYKVQETGFEFTIAEDNDAPEIVSARSIDLKKVEVTFNEPVKAVSNGYHTSKSNLAKKPISISGNKVTLSFNNAMSLGNTTIYVDGVEDYSGNKADKTIVITPELDQTRPEVIAVDVKDGKEFTVAFNKDVDKNDAIDGDNYVIKDSDGKVKTGNGLNSKGHPVVTIEYSDSKKEATFELRSSLAKGSYTIEISGIRDNSVIRNTMLPQTETFEVGDTGKPKLEDAWYEREEKSLYEYVYIQFSEAVATEGNGNALDIAKYDYKGEDDKYHAFPAKSTVDLVANDTVRINLPKASEEAKLVLKGGDNISRIQVRLVADLEGNFINGLMDDTEVKKGDTKREIAIESAKMTSQDTIEVTFTGKLESVSDSDFVLKGTKDYSVYFESFKNSAQKIAIFRTADKVGEDVYEWRFATEGSSFGTVGSFDAKLKANSTGEEVKDEINPTLNKIEALSKTEIALYFNEDVKTTGITTVGLTVSIEGKEKGFTIATGTAEKIDDYIKVTLASGVELKDGDEVKVVLKDVSDITDKAGNMAEGFEDYIYFEAE